MRTTRLGSLGGADTERPVGQTAAGRGGEEKDASHQREGDAKRLAGRGAKLGGDGKQAAAYYSAGDAVGGAFVSLEHDGLPFQDVGLVGQLAAEDLVDEFACLREARVDDLPQHTAILA